MRTRMKKALAAISLLLVVVLAGCDGDSVVDSTPESAEKFAEEIREMATVDGVDVFVGSTRRYLFVDGAREDAITLTRVTVDGTILVIETVSQGNYFFDLGKALSLNAADGWIVLNF